MPEFIGDLSPGGDARTDWRTINQLAAQLRATQATLKQAREDIAELRRLKKDPSGIGKLQMFVVKSIGQDHLVCRTFDGSNEGADDVLVAKPVVLRGSTGSETIDGESFSYSYTDLTEYQERVSSWTDDTGDQEEAQVIRPPWAADKIIFAARAKTGLTVSGSDVGWIADADRAWARSQVQ